MNPSIRSVLYAKRPWYHPLAILRRLINLSLLIYLLICVALFLLQNYLLFPREASGAVMSADEGARQAAYVKFIPWTDTSSGTAQLKGYVPHDFRLHPKRGTIVVFHGNAGCAFDRDYYQAAFATRGFQAFLYEYPGYGGRPGKPSAASIVGDAQTLIRSLDQAGYGPIYVWGVSVGSGIAAEVCKDTSLPVHGLTLLTPWDSLTNAAAYHYPFIPVSVLLWDKYDSISNLAHFQHPICVICSEQDEILPVRLGRNLFDHLPEPKKLILQPGCGHNDWPSAPNLTWWDDALNFIALPHAPAKP
jgi:alpha-beta hydrolase superfamily lysophospholipase